MDLADSIAVCNHRERGGLPFSTNHFLTGLVAAEKWWRETEVGLKGSKRYGQIREISCCAVRIIFHCYCLWTSNHQKLCVSSLRCKPLPFTYILLLPRRRGGCLKVNWRKGKTELRMVQYHSDSLLGVALGREVPLNPSLGIVSQGERWAHSKISCLQANWTRSKGTYVHSHKMVSPGLKVSSTEFPL